MKNKLTALFVGFIFSIGLGISGMTQPQKIIGFLDFSGNWDPSLIFVMIGAISFHSLAYKFIRKQKFPLFSKQWCVPEQKEITPALIIGSILFGIGWGLAGYCPGPALTSLATLEIKPFLFVLSMLTGMILFRFLNNKMSLDIKSKI